MVTATLEDHSDPRVDVVGLGPAGPELITNGAREVLARARVVVLRTGRHPASSVLSGAETFDHLYERLPTFDAVYSGIAEELVGRALAHGPVVYAVPGSPSVAERSVELLGRHPLVRDGVVALEVHPAVSFLDLAWTRLAIDPLEEGFRLVDAERFATGAAGDRGPLLVAQCWNRSVLSDIKLSVDAPPGTLVTILHHLGLADEVVDTVAWEDLDRSIDPDHLTSLWIPTLAAPVALELVRLDELVRTLRRRCPWDREQTHGSLARHLQEESYEVLEAIDELAALDATGGSAMPEAEERAVSHLEEELGDLLFQIFFHALLATEAGRFTLADVACGVHDKLVARHPQLFDETVAGAAGHRTPEQLAADWEALKLEEKRRHSVTEGIPVALPALALSTKLQKKALAVGLDLPGTVDEARRLTDHVVRLAHRAGDPNLPAAAPGDPDHPDDAARAVGDLLFALSNLARSLGVDPEAALRHRAARFRSEIERSGRSSGGDDDDAPAGEGSDGSFSHTSDRSDYAQ
ncbi:MAG: MazG nucleotide pyrophosphohydrolase domain-containing protein [Acidimicrobiales bacterium]